ncbi:YczE/YyaS/YitT family protein [Sporosarcina beigongshangi]|uniref:YczE/YyaS/YitT family protein n=1 Tax=Sporosarcina beigongshangi TaxID=2782538 RepID=UPI0019395C71|nr:YitT family protein [Sporosarcina beigongshangi]
MQKALVWRWTFYFTGLLVMALGVSMTIKGQKLGVGPWDVLHVGLYKHFGLTIGTWGIITGFVIIVATAIVLKQWPKIGTWLNMLLLGIFIDIFNWLLPDVTTFGGQMVIFIVGVAVMGYGSGIYISPNIGAGPRDSLMLVLVDKTGASVKKIRTTIEVLVAITGWLFGGPIGIGTVLVALFVGHMIHYSLPQSRRVLMKIIGEQDEKVLL